MGLRAKKDSVACPGRTLSFSDTSVCDPAHPTVRDLTMADDTEGILTDFSKRHSAARPCLDSGLYPRLHA